MFSSLENIVTVALGVVRVLGPLDTKIVTENKYSFEEINSKVIAVENITSPSSCRTTANNSSIISPFQSKRIFKKKPVMIPGITDNPPPLIFDHFVDVAKKASSEEALVIDQGTLKSAPIPFEDHELSISVDPHNEHHAVVDAFKAALTYEYGEDASWIFPHPEEAEARISGLKARNILQLHQELTTGIDHAVSEISTDDFSLEDSNDDQKIIASWLEPNTGTHSSSSSLNTQTTYSSSGRKYSVNPSEECTPTHPQSDLSNFDQRINQPPTSHLLPPTTIRPVGRIVTSEPRSLSHKRKKENNEGIEENSSVRKKNKPGSKPALPDAQLSLNKEAKALRFKTALDAIRNDFQLNPTSEVTVQIPSQQTMQLNGSTNEVVAHLVQMPPPQEVASERLPSEQSKNLSLNSSTFKKALDAALHAVLNTAQKVFDVDSEIDKQAIIAIESDAYRVAKDTGATTAEAVEIRRMVIKILRQTRQKVWDLDPVNQSLTEAALAAYDSAIAAGATREEAFELVAQDAAMTALAQDVDPDGTKRASYAAVRSVGASNLEASNASQVAKRIARDLANRRAGIDVDALAAAKKAIEDKALKDFNEAQTRGANNEESLKFAADKAARNVYRKPSDYNEAVKAAFTALRALGMETSNAKSLSASATNKIAAQHRMTAQGIDQKELDEAKERDQKDVMSYYEEELKKGVSQDRAILIAAKKFAQKISSNQSDSEEIFKEAKRRAYRALRFFDYSAADANLPSIKIANEVRLAVNIRPTGRI